LFLAANDFFSSFSLNVMSSSSLTNKENTFGCPGCRQVFPSEHVCSSQQLSDSVDMLLDTAQQQLQDVQTISLTHIHVKCQKELEKWHETAIAHLDEIYTQRLGELARVYNQDVCPELDLFKEKVTQQLKTLVIPRITKILDEPTPELKKIEQLQGVLSRIKCECAATQERPWISLQLPDVKSLPIPIKISKMAQAARLTDNEKDVLFEDSDEEMKMAPAKEKKENYKSRCHRNLCNKCICCSYIFT